MLAIGVLPVTVKTNSGKSVRGNLSGFTDSKLLIEEPTGITELSFDDLDSLVPQNVEEKTGPAFQVALTNGSRIAVQDLSLTGDELIIEPRRQSELRIPVKQVTSIRFGSPTVGIDAAWLGIVNGESRGDKLVIRRTEISLDPQPGIIESIAQGKVAFNLDGDTINAPITQLEGLVFGGAGPVNDVADIRVTDVYGSQWAVRSLGQAGPDQPLELLLDKDLKHKIPLDQIESIQWSGGLVMLATEEPASKSFDPYIKTNVKSDLVDAFFAPKVDGESDLIIHGSSSVEYRVDPGFGVFAGSVLRKKSVSKASKMSVVIELDGKEVWRESLLNSDPLGFELPLENARRVTIRVDGAGDGDLGETVRVLRPRLLK